MTDINKKDLMRQRWVEAFADNSNLDDENRGIILFNKTMFPDTIRAIHGVPDVHKEMFKEIFSLFAPEKVYSVERQLQEKLFRGVSKSTLTNMCLVTYVICFNGLEILLPTNQTVKLDEDLIVLASETGTMAETWVNRVRAELSSNVKIRKIFGDMRPQTLKDSVGKWTSDIFTAQRRHLGGKNVSYWGRGVGQQIRGINMYGRITFLIVDDPYSLHNTKTPESRHNVRYWYTAEAMNSLDPILGKSITIGTVVHEDTVIVDNEKKTDMHCISHCIMDEVKFRELIDKYCVIDRAAGTCEIPDYDMCKELEELGYVTAWPKRLGLDYLFKKFREAIESRTESMLWQEYFHLTLAEEDKTINAGMFQVREIELVEKSIDNYIVPFVKIGDQYLNVTSAIGIDAASSYKSWADNTAIIWVLMDSLNRIYVYMSRSGKFAIIDDIKSENIKADGSINYKEISLSTDYMTKINRVGCVDETFRMIQRYKHNPTLIIETNNTGGEVVKQFKARMDLYGRRLNCKEVVTTTNKVQRILDTLQPYYQSRAVYHSHGLGELQHQLEYLQSVKHEDEADILATTVAHMRKPASVPYSEKEKKKLINHFTNLLHKKQERYDEWLTH